jgi:cytochrome c oxidase assembly protein subunit 15
MAENLRESSPRPVGIWLLIGIGMLMIQVLLGGITRLTGSGLSITEWKPIMGAIPPMTDQQWNEAFDKYKQIAQYKYINSSFTLHDFKFIFFWEWFHRLWARLMGVVFIIPFTIFLIQGRIKKPMVRPLLILFLLGGLLGFIGWLMVATGLDDQHLYVSHYMLALHFNLGLGTICYGFWLALTVLFSGKEIIGNHALRNFTGWMIAILVLQLIYGAFMAGLRAAPYAPTWPDINGTFLPRGGFPSIGLLQFVDNPIMVHFIHRTLGYVIFCLIILWYFRSKKFEINWLLNKTSWIPFVIVTLQLVLGILTVLYSPYRNALIWLGVAHQFVAMTLLLSLVFELFILRGNKKLRAPGMAAAS